MDPSPFDAYVADAPEAARDHLTATLALVRAAVPHADEAIKYGTPTFVLGGNLIHVAAFKAHLGLYPAPLGHPDFRDELAPYASGKATARFLYTRPLPTDLIRRVVEHRVFERLSERL